MGTNMSLFVEQRLNNNWQVVAPGPPRVFTATDPAAYPRAFDENTWSRDLPPGVANSWKRYDEAARLYNELDWYAEQQNYDTMAVLADVRNLIGVKPCKYSTKFPDELSLEMLLIVEQRCEGIAPITVDFDEVRLIDWEQLVTRSDRFPKEPLRSACCEFHDLILPRIEETIRRDNPQAVRLLLHFW